MALTAGDWPEWRGPNRDGSVAAFRVPARWVDSARLVWRKEVGTGHSSPIVVADRIYQHSRQGDDEVVACYALEDGRQLWIDRYPVPYTMNPAASGHGKGPKSTPAASGGKLFTFGIDGILSVYDLENGRLYTRQVYYSTTQKTSSPDFGTAMSPLVDDGVVIAHVGARDDGALTAYEISGGELRTRWRWTGDGPGYASPIVAELAGTRAIVTQTQKMLVVLSAATGELLWSMPFETPYVQNIVTPVVYRDLVIFSGLDKGVFALRFKRGARGLESETVWETRDASFYMSSPVVFGDLLVGFSHLNRGQFVVLDARSGKKLWAGEPRRGENASLLHAGEIFFLLTNDGTLTVARASTQGLETLRGYTVASDPVWAHPVVIGRTGTKVLVRSATSLALWDLAS